jgi:bifunctional NMN adenylyltransferase/nudix hydrolase
MEQVKNKVGVIVGRFQTPDLHLGHQELIQKVCKEHKKVIIVLAVSRLKGDFNDPLDFDTRSTMLSSYMEKYRNINFSIVGIIDKGYDRDELWSSQLDFIINAAFPYNDFVLYGGRDSFIPHYTGKYETIELDIKQSLSATELRNKVITDVLVQDSKFRQGVIYGIGNQYPKVVPIVDIAIIQPEKLIVAMVKRSGATRWQFPGGYVDPTDETLEKAALREAYEETSLQDLGNIKYLGSSIIRDWRYEKSRDTMLGAFFVADYTHGTLSVIDKDEDIEEIDWVIFDNVGDIPFIEWVEDNIIPNHWPLMFRLKQHLNEITK